MCEFARVNDNTEAGCCQWVVMAVGRRRGVPITACHVGGSQMGAAPEAVSPN